MRTVNIAELKNRLSTYITYAKAGETVVIRDRNTPVAQLIPFLIDEEITEEERGLVADGILRLGKRPRSVSRLWEKPEAHVQGNAGVQAVLEEREEGW